MELLTNLLLKASIYILFLYVFNSLMIGKLNLWSISNIVYFSIGAYIVGYHANNFIYKPYSYLILFLLVSLICFLISLLFFRVFKLLKGDYFLFFSLFIIELNNVINHLIAGPSGYSHIVRPNVLSKDIVFLLITIIILLLVAFWIRNYNKSRLNIINSVERSSSILVSSFGINTNKINIGLFITTAIISGIAGILFSFYSYGADPNIFSTEEVIILFALIIFGGIDSIRGSIFASFVYVFLKYLLESSLTPSFDIYAPKISRVIFGLILISIPYILPKGIFGRREI